MSVFIVILHLKKPSYRRQHYLQPCKGIQSQQITLTGDLSMAGPRIVVFVADALAFCGS